MATLTGQTIASTYDALLKVTDNGPITSSLKLITDGLGNNTALSLSNVAASINGNVTATSFIKSSGTSTQYLMADGSVSTLTNPITGTGTTNTIPKFTGTSALGNSNITDSGTLISLGSDTTISSGGLGIGTSTLTGYNLRISKTITGTVTGYGTYLDSTIQSDVTSAAVLFRTTPSTAASAFTLASLQHFSAGATTIGAGSSITNQYGFIVLANAIGATNNYAFSGQLAAATNTWNLYNSGTANNFLAGSLAIGSTAITGNNIFVNKNITGSTTSYGIRSRGLIQSDVTGIAAYYDSTSETQATSFTLANLYHFRAQQATFGAGSTVTTQVGFIVAGTTIGATNNYAFQGVIPASLNNYNLYMSGTAANFLAGDVGIGVAASTTSSGPILTTTLTNGGSGYVDGTYTDVASTVISSGGVYALFTVVVSGGIVISATLTWGGSTYKVGETLTVSNTLLGGTGSGLIITVATVDSSSLKIANINGGDITLYRSDSSLTAADNIGTIKFESNDATAKASGIQAKISAFGGGSSGGGYLSFFTRSATAGSSLVEGLRVLENANVNIVTGSLGIGTTSLVDSAIRIGKGITGSTTATGIQITAPIQTDVTSSAIMFQSTPSQVAGGALTTLYHFSASQSTLSGTVTNQVGYQVFASLTSATNNFGFRSQIASGTNRWNLYMDGTANNYMAGALGIGTTTLTGYNVRIGKSLTGSTSMRGIYQESVIQSDVTALAAYNTTYAGTQAASFTLTSLYHYEAVQGVFGASSAVTNQTGFRVDSSLIGATNNYGFRGLLASGTGRWNLYMDGTANNYLAGSLGIGTTGLTATSLNILQNTTGAITGYGALISNTIQSDVTSSYRGFNTFVSTQATTFTIPNIFHYLAQQGTFGAGSTVSTQTGFSVSSSLVGAGTNYGFRGSIPAQTGAWNIYMDGTAANYLSGTTLIGSTTDNGSGAKLQVNGGITYVNIFNRRTASYTLVLSDQNDIVEMNVASANNLTVPLNSSVAFPIGTEIAVLQYGVGQTTIVATGGVTLRAKSGALKISGQYAGCTLVKVGTDEWYVIGDLTI